MKGTNKWISDGSVDWDDPTICSEELILAQRAGRLREFCVKSCLKVAPDMQEPFKQFLDYLELESWTIKDVKGFRFAVLQILRLVEPLYQYSRPSDLDLASWYMIGAFVESWNEKIDDVAFMWRTERKYLQN